MPQHKKDPPQSELEFKTGRVFSFISQRFYGSPQKCTCEAEGVCPTRSSAAQRGLFEHGVYPFCLARLRFWLIGFASAVTEQLREWFPEAGLPSTRLNRLRDGRE